MLNGIGPILKKHRLAKGLTIGDVETATKIRGKYIEAIEEENFEVLPGKVYLKGFVRSYIKFLEVGSVPEVVEIIEQDQVVEQQVEENVEEEPMVVKTNPENMVERSSIKRGPLVLGLGVLAIALLIGIQSCSKIQEDKPVDPDPVPPIIEEGPNEEVPPPVVPEVEEVTPQYEGLNLVVNVLDAQVGKTDSCWMQLSADGKIVFEGTLSEGAAQSIEANERINVTFGNAGAVQLTLNGQDLGVAGEVGKVVKKELTEASLSMEQ